MSIVFAMMLLFVTTLFFELSVASIQSLLPSCVHVSYAMVVLLIIVGNVFTNTERLCWLSASGTLSIIALCSALIISYLLEINRNWSSASSDVVMALSGDGVRDGDGGIFPSQLTHQTETELWRGPVSLVSGFGVMA